MYFSGRTIDSVSRQDLARSKRLAIRIPIVWKSVVTEGAYLGSP
jgi:hypothetical protein